MALYFYFADACVACLYNYTDHILTLPCAHSVAVSGPSGNVKIAPALIRATFVARVLTPQRRGSGLNAFLCPWLLRHLGLKVTPFLDTLAVASEMCLCSHFSSISSSRGLQFDPKRECSRHSWILGAYFDMLACPIIFPLTCCYIILFH